MAHKFGEIDYDLKFPNGQQIESEIDLVAAVMYMWGLDGKQAREKLAAGEFSEQDLQRAIDYWVEKTDGDRHWDESNLKESKLEDYKGYQFYWVTKDPQNGVVEIWKNGQKVMEVPSEKEAEEWVDELEESKRQKKISSISNKILSGADIHSSLMEALEDEDDLDTLGKESIRILKDITGLTWNYDFEFGDLWCFCTDNIPADVTVSNTDNQWSVFANDDKVGSFNSLEDAAKKASEIIKKAEDDWADEYVKQHPEVDPSSISVSDLKNEQRLKEEKSLKSLLKTALAACGRKMDDWWYNYASMWHDSCVGLKKELKQSSENIEDVEEYKNLVDAIDQARAILSGYKVKYKQRVDKVISDYSAKWDISDDPDIENLNSELAALEKVASLPKSTLTDVNELSKIQNWF